MQIEFSILISRRNKRGRFVKDLFLFLGVITFCNFFERFESPNFLVFTL